MIGEKPAPANASPVVVRQAPKETLHIRSAEPLVELRLYWSNPKLLEVIPANDGLYCYRCERLPRAGASSCAYPMPSLLHSSLPQEKHEKTQKLLSNTCAEPPYDPLNWRC